MFLLKIRPAWFVILIVLNHWYLNRTVYINLFEMPNIANSICKINLLHITLALVSIPFELVVLSSFVLCRFAIVKHWRHAFICISLSCLFGALKHIQSFDTKSNLSSLFKICFYSSKCWFMRSTEWHETCIQFALFCNVQWVSSKCKETVYVLLGDTLHANTLNGLPS